MTLGAVQALLNLRRSLTWGRLALAAAVPGLLVTGLVSSASSPSAAVAPSVLHATTSSPSAAPVVDDPTSTAPVAAGSTVAVGGAVATNLSAPVHAPATPQGGSAANSAKGGSAVGVSSGALGPRVAVGAYVDGMDTNPGLLNTFDQTVGRKTTIASIFRGYGDIFPSQADVALTNGGQRSLLVAWYLDVDRFTGYTSGAHDGYLDQEAAAAKAYGATIYIRPWAEMNGDWQDFQPTASGSAKFGGTPAQFIAAWQHVVNRFRLDGATNVRWVFNPTADTYAQTTNVSTIWPGAQYVDVLGMDGYNWGNGGGLTWRSFDNIFTAQYQRLTALSPTDPVWICEFGSKEPTMSDGAPIDPNDSKAQWYIAALASTNFPRVKALIAFDADKERDWLVTSSPAVPTAIRAGLQR
jgi:mannan endo-1,4-beta-mannosidase